MSAVIQFVIDHSRPAHRVRGDWAFCPRSANLLRYPGDADSMATSLREQFPIEELLAARAFTRKSGGEPQLSRTLAATERPYFPLKKKDATVPHDLANQVGSLVSSSLPPLNCHEYPITGWSFQDGAVFAPVTDEDWVTLEQLGLATTPAASLARTSANQSQRLLQYNPFRQKQCRLLLVAWDISALSRDVSPEVLAVVDQLYALESTCKRRSAAVVQFWRPNDESLEQIKWAARLRCAASVRKTIFNDLQSSSWDLSDFCKQLDREKVLDIATARRELDQVIQKDLALGLIEPNLASACAAFERAVAAEIVLPSFACVVREVDPRRAGLAFTSAQLMQKLQGYDPLWLHAQQLLHSQSLIPSPRLPPDYLDQLIKFANGVLPLCRELSKKP